MTFRQAQELGACVRKGETSAMVVYANRISKTETDGEGREIERDIPFLKAYSVFNVEQTDGLGDRYADGSGDGIVQRVERIQHADAFFAKTGAIVRHGGDKAFYAPGPDLIQMPPIESFRDVESYYATLAHESVHWAGATHRLNRDLSKYAKDRTERAREELIAELGAAFLAADLGIVPETEPRPDHASYLASWLSVLRKRQALHRPGRRSGAAVRGLSSRPAVGAPSRCGLVILFRHMPTASERSRPHSTRQPRLEASSPPFSRPAPVRQTGGCGSKNSQASCADDP